MDGSGNVGGVFVADSEHLDHHRRRSVESGPGIGFFKAVDHAGHIGQTQATAVGPRHQGQVFVLPAPISLTDGPEQNLPRFGFHRTARQIHRRAANGLGHIVEREPVPAEVGLGHLDCDFVGANTPQVGLGNALQIRNLVTNLLAQQLEREFIGISGERNIDHLQAGDYFLNHGLFGLERKRRDSVDTRLDLVEQLARVVAGLDFNGDRRRPFGGGRGDALDALQALDSLFYPHHDGGLDFFGGRSQIGNRDRNDVDLELRGKPPD